MALSDPLSLTINSVANSLPRTEVSSGKSIYSSADGNLKLTISHTSAGNGRMRHLVRADQRVVASDPLMATSTYKTLSIYMVIDNPDFGFTATTVGYLSEALKSFLSVATVGRVIANES